MGKEKKSGGKRKARKAPSAPAKKTARAKGAASKALVSEPTGSCRYADSFGQIQCESPVTKSYCDGKGGQFVEGGRC